jgi:hypothetical protein
LTYEEALAQYKKAVEEDTGCWSTMRARESAAVVLADAVLRCPKRNSRSKTQSASQSG